MADVVGTLYHQNFTAYRQPTMNFSKSKILAMRQCPKRLWLEVLHPEWREDSDRTEAVFATGDRVGEIAQRLYDPLGVAAARVIDVKTMGFAEKAGALNVFQQTAAWMKTPFPIFEAAFQAKLGKAGTLSFADVMLPIFTAKQRWTGAWRMVEVKSSTSVKDYYLDDLLVQAHNALQSGVRLQSVAVAHVNNHFVYRGDGQYQDLLVEQDLSSVIFPRLGDVAAWVSAAEAICAEKSAPAISTGEQCHRPYECGFYQHCRAQEPSSDHPVDWLPRKTAALKEKIAAINAEKNAANTCADMRDLPDECLNAVQQRVRDCTINHTVYFNQAKTREALISLPAPWLFLDFETCMTAVPTWAGTRPYQQIPFQYSLHVISKKGACQHRAFLDLSGNDPSRSFAQSLLQHVAEWVTGKNPKMTIFAYNAPFEKRILNDLAKRLALPALTTLSCHLVDLLPIVREHYYHPAQQGSWSIKSVLPAMCPELDYQNLDGIADGSMAMSAHAEAINPHTTAERKAQIHDQLLAYCQLDTLALVEIWKKLNS